MKYLYLTVLVSILLVSCNKPVTPPPPPTCDGKALGSINSLGCPVGDVGVHTQVCQATGWAEADNTCAAAPATCGTQSIGAIWNVGCPAGQLGVHNSVCTDKGWADVDNTCSFPAPPAATCDGKAAGSIKTGTCPTGQLGSVDFVCNPSGAWVIAASTCASPTPPPPGSGPTLDLPLAVKTSKGNSVYLQVEPQTGVTYTWSNGATGPSITVTPTADSQYSVTATLGGASSSASVATLLQ